MKIEKSTVVRTGLEKWIRSLSDGIHTELGIELSGRVVAVLTTTPKGIIPPLKLSAEHARKNWANLLAAVSTGRGRFYFERDLSGKRVYLIRAEGHENPFVRQWVDHSNEWNFQSAGTPAVDMEELQQTVTEQLRSMQESLAKFETNMRGLINPNKE